jgi:hypothetical protein
VRLVVDGQVLAALAVHIGELVLAELVAIVSIELRHGFFFPCGGDA